jgi:hypothetical protein
MRSSRIECVAFTVLFAALGTVLAAQKDLVKVGGSVVVEEGQRVKDAVAVGGDVTVRGEVTNDAVAVGGSVFLSPDAVVQGSAVSVGGEVVQPEGAQVNEDVVEISVPFVRSTVRSMVEEGWRPVWRTAQAVSFVGFLALALILVALFPSTFEKLAVQSRTKPLEAGLWGLIGVVLIVPVMVLLAISLVGIPLIPFEILFVVLAMVVGYIGIGLMIGQGVARAFKKDETHVVLSTLIGVALLGLVGWVPFLGGIVRALASLIGFGAALVLLRRWLQQSRAQRSGAETAPGEAG